MTMDAVARTARGVAPWSLPFALTGLSLGWTVYAVGEILSRQAPEPLAYAVGGIYDAVWLYALAMETAHRRQGSKGTLPAVLGWLFLVTSVAVLFTHGEMFSTPVVAVIGAVVPAAAKATLIMAVDRGATRISPQAQAKIDAVRSATRDNVAVGRAVTGAKTVRHKTAAVLNREEHEALGWAQKTRHGAAEKFTKATSKHPVADVPQEVPELFSDDDLARVLGLSDDDLARVLGQWTAESVSPDTLAVSPGVSPDTLAVSPQVSPVPPGLETPAPQDEGDDPDELWAAPLPDLSGLGELAAEMGVETPIPSGPPAEPLTEKQIEAVLRLLLRSENAPVGFRSTYAVFRQCGFKARQERVHRVHQTLVAAKAAEA